ncbi:MAG TPA: hypothetical protein VFD36_29315 [Kofleriaceae bacterium]|nr:hypothetical protein [Kofleriaceae bacterium]
MPKQFYNLPSPWNPGYAIPDYVMAEPPARGAMVTQWLPRGTISAVEPDYHLGPGKQMLGRKDAGLMGSLSGSSLAGSSLAGGCFSGGHSLSGDSLGATRFALEPMGADATAPVPAVVIASPTITRNRLLAGAAILAGAYLLHKKMKKGRRK